MQKLLAWSKSNLIIVIAMPVALIIFGAGLFFSARWNAAIRKTVGDDVSQTVSQLNALDVNYEIPSFGPSQPAWSEKMTPNPAATSAVEEVLRRLSSDSLAVRDEAIRRNQAGHTPLLEGLLPRPADAIADGRLRTEIISRWPAANAELLTKSRMGMPTPVADMLARLQIAAERERNKLTAGRVQQTLTPEEEEGIRSLLSMERLAAYRREAENLTAYADVSVLPGVRPVPPGELPSLETIWEWQWQFWVHQDVIRAVVAANTDSFGNWLSVAKAAVKRIERLEVEPLAAPAQRAGGSAEDEAAPPASDDLSQPITLNYNQTHTGRVGWPVAPNPFYDVRYVRLDVLVDSNRLTQLINAFAATDFMTVVDLDVESLNPYDDLAYGFYYGDDYLVLARLRIETIWIRSWTRSYMPESVRRLMGVPDEPPPSEEAAPAEAAEESTEN